LWAIQKLKRRGKRQAFGEKGCSEERRKRFSSAALENSSHPYRSKKKKKRCWGYPKDYASNVQMPSRIGQFSSQLTSHGTVAKDQFAKDRHLLN